MDLDKKWQVDILYDDTEIGYYFATDATLGTSDTHGRLKLRHCESSKIFVSKNVDELDQWNKI